MVAFGGQMVRELFPTGLRRLIATPPLDLSGGAADRRADLLAARSLAGVGVAALLALPLLMLASLALRAPLAAPAFLALGYFAVAQAITIGRPRSEAAWSIAIFAGLAGWVILFALIGGEPRSAAGLCALLLAPFFAAAPTFARYLLAPKRERGLSAALEQARCLDQLAPAEAVLFVDGSGRLLAATRAGLTALGTSARAEGEDVSQSFQLLDRPALLDALRDCRSGGGPVEITVRAAGESEPGEPPLAVTVVAGPQGTASLRLRRAARAAAAAPPAVTETETGSWGAGELASSDLPEQACDVQEALSFAVRHVGPKARSRDITLICEGNSNVVAACDRRSLRRILHLLIEAAMPGVGRGGLVRVAARRLKGAVLLRVFASASLAGAGVEGKGADVAAPIDLTALRDMVDQAGGSLVADRRGGELTLSVRLAPARNWMAEQGRDKRVEAA